MPTFLKASAGISFDGLVGSELWYEVVENGTFDPGGGGQLRPRYDLVSYTIRHRVERRIVRKENGIHRVIFPDALSPSGRNRELLDKNGETSTYTLTKAEQLALRSLYPAGLPGALQLAWEREIHGPMSPTFEQSVVAENESAVNGLTFTVTAPTSGNLLVICHGNNDGDANTPSLSSGFTHHVTSTPPNFEPSMSMLSKISAGTEGTSIVVTHTASEADPNSGWFAEISGMITTSYTDGFNDVDSNGNVTSRATGNITTTNADDLLIAAWGYDMTGSPTSHTYDPTSFVQQAFIEGIAAAADHGTRVAVRTVSATGTYGCTMNWSGSTQCGGVIGAFKIDAGSPPVLSLPSGYLPTTYAEARTISEMRSSAPNISVAAGVEDVASIAFTCTSGKGVFTATESGSTTISGNGTNAMTLIGGTETNLNDTLATFAFQGAQPTQEKVTITVIATDGALNDNDSFVVFNDVTSLSVTATSFAAAQNCIASLYGRLPSGETEDTITITVTDDDDLEDEQVITLNAPASEEAGGELGQQKMFHYLGLGF